MCYLTALFKSNIPSYFDLTIFTLPNHSICLSNHSICLSKVKWYLRIFKQIFIPLYQLNAYVKFKFYLGFIRIWVKYYLDSVEFWILFVCSGIISLLISICHFWLTFFGSMPIECVCERWHIVHINIICKLNAIQLSKLLAF